jgi:dTDP-glucose 4,6-dehydratase
LPSGPTEATPGGKPYSEQISYMTRAGQDRCCAIDARKPKTDPGCRSAETLKSDISKTVKCYLESSDWFVIVQSGAYMAWMSKQYKEVTK